MANIIQALFILLAIIHFSRAQIAVPLIIES